MQASEIKCGNFYHNKRMQLLHLTQIFSDGFMAKATNTKIFLQQNLQKFDKATRLSCYKTFVRSFIE